MIGSKLIKNYTYSVKAANWLRGGLKGLDVPKPIPVIRWSSKLTGGDTILKRRGAYIDLVISDKVWCWGYGSLLWYLACGYYWYQQSGCSHAVGLHLMDGEHAHRSPLAFASRSGDVVPIPDAHFFRQRGYINFRKASERSNLAWKERSDEIIWRGAPSGTGAIQLLGDDWENPAVVHRIRLALRAKGSQIDFKFADRPSLQGRNLFLHAGVLGDPIPSESWAGRKFAIDIDGYVSAWSNLMSRLHQGCCVIKVESQFGYYQWYYDRLKPYEHYVPVKADLSNFFDQIEWARSHQNECEEIARNGQELARSMTLESETRVAGELMEEYGSV